MELVKAPTSFDLTSDFQPTGDQPTAIGELTDGLQRGDPYQTLLGATGTGKSVGYDDPVFVVEQCGDRMIPRVLPIGRLVDEAIEQAADPVPGQAIRQEGDTTVLPFAAPRYYAQSFDPETGEVGLYPISAFTRHATPSRMYRLRTACGRETTLTGDHNLWVLRGGRLRLIETAEARPTDYVPVPETLPTGPGKKHLNTLTALAGQRLFVTAPDALRAYAEVEGPGALALPLRESGLRHPYGKLAEMRRENPLLGGIAVDTFQHLLERTANLGGRWNAAQAFVGAKSVQNRLPARLALTPEVLRLLGYYVAEGCCTRGYVVLANRDAAVRQDIEAALKQLGLPFGIRPSSDYQISSTALARLLGQLCGKKSGG